jgi:hypothetical protein
MGGELRAFLGGYIKAELRERAYDRADEQAEQLFKLENEQWRSRQQDERKWDKDIEINKRIHEAEILKTEKAYEADLYQRSLDTIKRQNIDAARAHFQGRPNADYEIFGGMDPTYLNRLIADEWDYNFEAKTWISPTEQETTLWFANYTAIVPSNMAKDVDFKDTPYGKRLYHVIMNGGTVMDLEDDDLTPEFIYGEGDQEGQIVNVLLHREEEPLGFEVLTDYENKIFNDTFWRMLSGKQGIPIWMDGAFLTSPDEDLDVYLRAEELLSNTSIHWQTILQKLGKASKPAAHAGRIMYETMEFYSEENSDKVNTLLQDIFYGTDTSNNDEKVAVIVILESRRAWDNTDKIDGQINSIESTMDPAVLEAMGLSLENGGGQPESETPAAVVPGPEPAPAPEGVSVPTNPLGPENGIVQVSVPGQRGHDFKLNKLGKRKMAEAYAAYHASRGIGRPDTASDLRFAIARKFGFKLGNPTHVAVLTAIIAQYDPGLDFHPTERGPLPRQVE